MLHTQTLILSLVQRNITYSLQAASGVEENKNRDVQHVRCLKRKDASHSMGVAK